MLLRKSEVDIRLAKYTLSTGDAYMNDIGIYHCEQGLEQLLKHILQNYGGMADNNNNNLLKLHDMNVLIGLVEDKAAFSIPDGLKEMASDLTEWRITARYGDEHVGSIATTVNLIRWYDEIRTALEERERCNSSNI